MPTDDLNTLNKNYGATGRIAFRKGPGGYPLMSLAENRGACEVALYGGQVLSYRPLGHAPVLWMAKNALLTPRGRAIRGGIPVCWPWFGPHPDKADLPLHGFARLRRWRLVRTEYDSQRTSACLRLHDDETTHAMWPYAFRLELNIVVENGLHLELTTTNRDKSPLTLSQALHSYFLIRDIRKIEIRGLEGVKYIDTTAAANHGKQQGAIRVKDEVDRIYQRTKGECTLVDNGIGRNVTIKKRGSQSTVVWNPWIEKSKRMPDLGNEDFNHFVCIETTNADDDAVVIEPGAQHMLGVSLHTELHKA